MKVNLMLRMFMAILLMSAASGEALAQKVLLRLDLSEGQAFSYVNSTDQIISQDIMGMNQVIKQKIVLYYDATVSSVNPDDSYSLDYTYTRVTFNMDGGPMLGVIEYDSDDQDAEVADAARGYAGLVGQQFSTLVNDRGEILEVTGIDEMLDAMMEQFSDMGAAQQEAMRESMKTQFGNEAMKSNMQNSSPSFPEDKVKRGQSWTVSGQTNSGFTINTESTNTLEKVTQDGYEISILTTQSTDPESSMEMNGMTMVYDLTGESTGTQIIDSATGMVKSLTLNQNMEGNVNASGGALGAGMEWPMSIQSTITLELEGME